MCSMCENCNMSLERAREIVSSLPSLYNLQGFEEEAIKMLLDSGRASRSNTISEFRGEYGFLSNFYAVPVVFEGLMYLNSEAAFQSAKTTDMSVREEFTHLSAVDAKRRGRYVRLREDWENVKLSVMYQVCWAKFSQNECLKKRLIDTGDANLEEGNTWGDRYWGTVNGVGENNLGKILMRVRAELRQVN